MSLKGRKALVMGGSKGLGFACAEAMAKRGVSLHLLARHQQRLEQASQRLRSDHGIDVSYDPVDITDEPALQKILDTHVDCDILVSNCGGPPLGGFEAFDLADWDAAYQSQVRSAVQVCRTLIPAMAERQWGRLIMITSISVGTAIPGLVLSNSLRPGLLGLARSLTREYAHRGITANLLCPGLTLTDRLEALIQKNMEVQGKTRDQVIAGMTAAIPAGRLGRPHELGETAAFLASDGAAFISGQALFIDGGQTS